MQIVIDGREFVSQRNTGIGRALAGLCDALIESRIFNRMVIAVHAPESVPADLKHRRGVLLKKVPRNPLLTEMILSKLAVGGADVFFSPYPKLPLICGKTPTVHMVHDVIDLTYPSYRQRPKSLYQRFRLIHALGRARITWYPSEWSLKETAAFLGRAGRCPRIRPNGIGKRFDPEDGPQDGTIRDRHGLRNGYILSVGNGSHHKNIGVILEAAATLKRPMVFVGVPPDRQAYWRRRCPVANVRWISHLPDGDLPAIIRGAFCLAQPSLIEGYGYPPLESMACGIPTVVSNIAVLLETTGGCAITADPHRPETWKAAFDALEDRDFHRLQVERGLEWVRPLRGKNGWQNHMGDMRQMLAAHSSRSGGRPAKTPVTARRLQRESPASRSCRFQRLGRNNGADS